MYQTINTGSFSSTRELTGPRQLRSALDFFRGSYHRKQIQIRLLRVNGQRVVRYKDPMDATCFIRAAIAGGLLLALSLSSALVDAKMSPQEAAPIVAALHPLVPAGCTLTTAFEDYTGRAVCAGAYVVHLNAQGMGEKATDIPVAIDTRIVGPDAAGAYHDWPVFD